MPTLPPDTSDVPAHDGGGKDEVSSSSAELEFLRRLRAREEGAFIELIDRHHNALVRLALLFVSSRAVADEVVQETWLAVLDGLDGFDGRSTLKTWIFRILSNRAKTRGIRENRTVPLSSFWDGDGDGDHEPAVDRARFKANGMWNLPPARWEDGTPERILMNKHALARLETAISALPPGQRAVVILRDIEGLDSAEVCNILSLSETNQRVLLHRARSKLRAMLEEHMDGK